jgi:CPA1 family monovalent cation:H+ antiporter
MRKSRSKPTLKRALVFAAVLAAILSLATSPGPLLLAQRVLGAGDGGTTREREASEERRSDGEDGVEEARSTLFLFILEAPNDAEKRRRILANREYWNDRLLEELEDEYRKTREDIYFELAEEIRLELHPWLAEEKEAGGTPAARSILQDLEPVIETFVWLLIVIFIMAVVAERLKLPYTIVLVLAGLIAGSLPVLRGTALSHDLVFFLFLPPLLFEGAINLRFDHLRENLFPIILYATLGVALSILITGGLVAFASPWAGLNLSLILCLLFGSLISATDPVSVLSITKKMGAPRRLSIILEGESLFNDGTAVVLFTIIHTIAKGGGLEGAGGDWLGMVWAFLKMVAIGGAIGFGIGYTASLITLRINDHLIEITLSTIVAFGTFLVAEALHVSGVIAVVVAGITIGNFGFEVGMSPTTRLSMRSFWEYAAFLINSLVFLLVGIQVKFSVLAKYALAVGIAILAALASRAIVVYILAPVVGRFDKRLPWTYQHVLIWGGLRGALSMALALSLSPVIEQGLRQEILAMTFGVAVFSLLVQGLTVGGFVRRLGLTEHDRAQRRMELAVGKLAMLYGALEALSRLNEERAILPEVEVRLRQELRDQASRMEEEVETLQLEHEPLVESQMESARRTILRAAKSDLLSLMQAGTIGSEAYKQLVKELDEELDRLRMSGEE